MKVSRFEPHILAPLAENNDLDVFMRQIEEESQSVVSSRASSQSFSSNPPTEEIKRNVHRIVEALSLFKQKKKRASGAARASGKSKKQLALLRYETQKLFNFDNFTQYSKKL